MTVELLKDMPLNQQRTEYRTGTHMLNLDAYNLIDDVPLLRTGDRAQLVSDPRERIIFWRYGSSSETRVIQAVLDHRGIRGVAYVGEVDDSLIATCLDDDYRFVWVQGPSLRNED